VARHPPGRDAAPGQRDRGRPRVGSARHVASISDGYVTRA
jgi:hypothetical protein